MHDPAERTLADLLDAHVDRERYRALHWEGSFADYLAIAEERPGVARNAWQRLYDMVESHGVRPALAPGGPPRFGIFDDPFGGGRDAVYGLDSALAELVRILRAGAHGLGPERRVILLHGPVGSAKSTIARLLKRGLEEYSRSDVGALYTFDWHVDGEVVPSPMHQDPFYLVPREARATLAAHLDRRHRASYSLAIDGELDPVSRFYYDRLLAQHDGDWRRVVEHVRVRRFVLSERERVGIGTFQPKDEKNQDSTELTGDLNYRKIAEYGSDSDPRAFNFDGEFNIANRGMLELIEVLKLDVAFLYDLLGATQEHSIKPKKFTQTHIDEVILGHTNEPEFKKLQSNQLMEAFRDRTIKIDVPYNLAVSDEVRIYRRQFEGRRIAGRSIAPHTLDIAALWAVLTRLEPPTHPNLSLLQKAQLYDGGAVQGFGPEHVREMRAAAEREGLEGISPRYVQDRIATCMVDDKPCVGARDVLDAIAHGLAHHSLVSNEDTRRRYLELVDVAREEYEERIKKEVQEAIASDREALDRLCAKYLDNVRAYTTREPVIDGQGQESDPDERLMRSIEEKVEISEGRKDDFRHELMNFVHALEGEGRTFDWTRNRRLARALELKVFEDRRDSIQLTSLVSTVVDPDTQAKIGVIRERLMRLFGYDEVAADEVLVHVAGLFARGEAKSDGLEAA
ncbi:MAG TPA: serine protein kinase [Planctomycetota bacterium]|nr:serine protein kinase [Planctomycetota bacterium]